VTTDNTLLVLTGVGIPPYSARGLRQTLTPIGASISLRRTVNGSLTDLSASQFQKYASTISGDDQEPPAVDGVWPGRTVTVDCLQELTVAGEETTDAPDLGRDIVPGSIRYSNGFIFYRPRLTMLVTGFNVEGDEWAAGVSWSMNLEEV
jgi:hypothetical protein